MSRFYLSREFQESDGLELVIFHWCITARGGQPDWRDAYSMPLQNQPHKPSLRGAAVPIDLSGQGPWVLHSFFQTIRRGVTETGPAYFEDLVTREISHREHDPNYTHATLVYNIGEDGWTNAKVMQLEGVKETAFVTPEWPANPQASLADRNLCKAADQLPLPRVFKAAVIAPAGARVLYSIHLQRRQGLNPMADTGRWIPRQEVKM